MERRLFMIVMKKNDFILTIKTLFYYTKLPFIKNHIINNIYTQKTLKKAIFTTLLTETE